MNYEIFMPIKDYEDTYAVSNLGRVKNIKTGRILKPTKLNNGYMQVKLCKNGEKKSCKVHRLVLETFKANSRNCSDINHIDENKENNTLNNLEWCTRKENNNHGTRNERAVATRKANGTYEKIAKLNVEKYSIPVYCITNNTVYKSSAEASRELNLNQGNINRCCKRKQKSTGGYQFKYFEEGDLL